MRKKKVSAMSLALAFAAVVLALAHTDRHSEEHPSVGPEHPVADYDTPYFRDQGKLPGITWADDVHPIFIRNKCGQCHMRGNEIIVDVLQEFALGMIDPKDLGNAYYSYHELVYAEGPPHIQKGETFRDGQCCWPKDYPPHKQRRIWLGHAERSVIVRKLEQGYYDWEKPPRFLEEGLGLLWGPPMPWYETEEHHRGTKDESEIHRLKVRSFLGRALLYLSLWVGKSQDDLHTLPPQIPVKDRDVLRYWINHAFQVMEEGTGIEVHVLDAKRKPIKNASVHFVGNFNHLKRQQVSDHIGLKTSQDGKALLSFPRYSVISTSWSVAAEKSGLMSEYQTLRVSEGTIHTMSITIPQK